jgi:hypothetical protein
MDGLRVSEHASESGCWRISSLAPIGPTGLHVSAFHAYEERGTAFRRRRELPDGSAVLIFNLGKELRVVDRAGVHAVGEGDGFFSGASATYVITETDGAQMGAQVKFSLLGARRFLARPLGELGDTLVDPPPAFGRCATELGERVADAHSQKERLQLLARAVELRLGSEATIAPELAFPSQPGRYSRSRSRARRRDGPRTVLESLSPRVRALAEEICSHPALRPRSARAGAQSCA